MILSLILLLNIIKILGASEGVIWSKYAQDFIPIYGISSFADARNNSLKEHFLKKEDWKLHNFHKENITILYYDEINFFDFIDNDTKVTGVIGEVWNCLSDYLNFTLIPIKLNKSSDDIKKGSYVTMIELLQKNKTLLVARAGISDKYESVLDYTSPFWRIRYHLYIKPAYKHDEFWIYHTFSDGIWYSILLLLFLLSITGYMCDKFSINTSKEKIDFNLQDHMLYTVAQASSKGDVPIGLNNKSKFIYFLTSLFAQLTLIAFSSHAIYLMMYKKNEFPFSNLEELMLETKYDIISFSGSMSHQNFINLITENYYDLSRVHFTNSNLGLFEKVCAANSRKLAAFAAEDRYRSIGTAFCKLMPTSASYFETYVTSALLRGHAHKHSFDVGILKLKETGLMDILIDRWLNWKTFEKENILFQSIDLSQVYIIFVILLLGIVGSFSLLFIEKLIYWYNTQREK